MFRVIIPFAADGQPNALLQMHSACYNSSVFVRSKPTNRTTGLIVHMVVIDLQLGAKNNCKYKVSSLLHRDIWLPVQQVFFSV